MILGAFFLHLLKPTILYISFGFPVIKAGRGYISPTTLSWLEAEVPQIYLKKKSLHVNTNRFSSPFIIVF